MADVRLIVRVKNARILRAMERAGIDSVAELCRRLVSGSPSEVGALINFRHKPIDRNGEWRELAMDVATALHREPEELWPEYLKQIEARTSTTQIDATVEQFAALAGSEQALLQHDSVKRLLSAVPAREAEIVGLRFGLNGGEHTLAETGKIIERPVTQERVRGLEARALRRMRRRAYLDDHLMDVV